MARIDDLLRIDGVLAAGELTPDGTLVDYKTNTNMSRELAASTAQFCATASMLFNTLAGAYSQLTGMNWTPQQGWAYRVRDLTVAVGGRFGVFIKTEKANFNQLFQVLVGQPAARQPRGRHSRRWPAESTNSEVCDESATWRNGS